MRCTVAVVVMALTVGACAERVSSSHTPTFSVDKPDNYKATTDETSKSGAPRISLDSNDTARVMQMTAVSFKKNGKDAANVLFDSLTGGFKDAKVVEARHTVTWGAWSGDEEVVTTRTAGEDAALTLAALTNDKEGFVLVFVGATTADDRTAAASVFSSTAGTAASGGTGPSASGSPSASPKPSASPTKKPGHLRSAVRAILKRLLKHASDRM